MKLFTQSGILSSFPLAVLEKVEFLPSSGYEQLIRIESASCTSLSIESRRWSIADYKSQSIRRTGIIVDVRTWTARPIHIES